MSSSGSPKDTAETTAVVNRKFLVASCQILCGEDKAANIAVARQAVKDASAAGAQVSAHATLHSSCRTYSSTIALDLFDFCG